MSVSTITSSLLALIKEDTVNIPRVAADQERLTQLVNATLAVAAVVCVLFVIIGGLRFVTSQGDPKAVQAGREMITYAIVGLIVVLMSFAIVQVVILIVNPA